MKVTGYVILKSFCSNCQTTKVISLSQGLPSISVALLPFQVKRLFCKSKKGPLTVKQNDYGTVCNHILDKNSK